MWLNNFKIALVQKDIASLEKLVNDIPKFETVEEMEQASVFIKQAIEIFVDLRDKTLVDMNKMKKNIKFLKSSIHYKSDPKERVSFDIQS